MNFDSVCAKINQAIDIEAFDPKGSEHVTHRQYGTLPANEIGIDVDAMSRIVISQLLITIALWRGKTIGGKLDKQEASKHNDQF